MATSPDPDEPYWGIDEVAAYLGDDPSTVRAYRSRRQMPTQDMMFGRSPAWRPATIMTWRPKPVEVPDWRLIDLRLSKLECESHKFGFATPLSFENKVIPTVTPLGNGFVLYQVRYELEISDRNKHRTATLNITLAGLYEGLPAEEPPIAVFNAFGTEKVLPFFHNYLRVEVHTWTGWMGMPPLVIDLMNVSPDSVRMEPSPTKV